MDMHVDFAPDPVNLVNALLEAEIVRVCSSCEQEFGRLKVPSGALKSHGSCRRHALVLVANDLRDGYLDTATADKLRQYAETQPDSAFPPDRAQS